MTRLEEQKHTQKSSLPWCNVECFSIVGIINGMWWVVPFSNKVRHLQKQLPSYSFQKKESIANAFPYIMEEKSAVRRRTCQDSKAVGRLEIELHCSTPSDSGSLVPDILSKE